MTRDEYHKALDCLVEQFLEVKDMTADTYVRRRKALKRKFESTQEKPNEDHSMGTDGTEA